MDLDLKDPWLVAAWPGMGGVALVAASYLAKTLGAQTVGEIPPGDHFDVDQITVKNGLVETTGVPRSTLYAWKDPEGRRDLVIFLGEAQPSSRGFAFCSELLRRAEELGVSRVFTFAAMATPSHPGTTPRVFAVATRPAHLDELRREEVELLEEGEISGMNGVLLAAAAGRDLGGTCLLGEFPYFASGVPNPKASAAVLRVFGHLAGLDLDLDELDEQAVHMEQRLGELLKRLQQAAESRASAEEPDLLAQARLAAEEEEEEEEDAGLDPAEVARVEDLFVRAKRDRGQAMELKAELDRLGVFKEYEDRFLDLFRRAE